MWLGHMKCSSWVGGGKTKLVGSESTFSCKCLSNKTSFQSLITWLCKRMQNIYIFNKTCKGGCAFILPLQCSHKEMPSAPSFPLSSAQEMKDKHPTFYFLLKHAQTHVRASHRPALAWAPLCSWGDSSEVDLGSWESCFQLWHLAVPQIEVQSDWKYLTLTNYKMWNNCGEWGQTGEREQLIGRVIPPN